MANRIKGITMEIGGDTTGPDKALKCVNSSITKMQSDLNDGNRLLKLDPSNMVLVAQKQELLAQAVSQTEEKLSILDTVDDGQAIEWLSDAYDIACEEMGGDRNVIGGSIQVDERHEYVDARTGRTEMSRQHLHVYAIPEYEGRLNAKKVMTKGNMTRMNNRIEAMSRERYGLPWLTGEGRKSTESMDALKAKSAKAMIEKAEKQASEIVERARNKANTIINNATDQRLEAEDMYTDARKTRQKSSESLSEASERLETAKSREEAVERREKAVKRSEMSLEKSKADIRHKEKRLDAREEQIKSESKTLTELRTELEQLTISKVRLLGSKREWVHKEAVKYKDNPTAQNAQELLDALQQLDDNKQDKGMTL